MNLSERQRKFADSYLATGNVYRSAVEAGYSKKYAKGEACHILDNMSVKSYLDEQRKKLNDSKIAQASEVMEYLTRLLRGEEDEEIVVVEGSGDGVSEARKMSKRVAQKDRIKAAELLGKRYGIFNEKPVEVVLQESAIDVLSETLAGRVVSGVEDD